MVIKMLIVRFLLYSLSTLILLNFEVTANAQVKTDTLELRLNKTQDTAVRVDLLLRLAENYIGTNYSLSQMYAVKAVNEAENYNNSTVKQLAYRRTAYIHYYNSNYSDAMEYLLKKLRLADSLHNSTAKAWVYNFMGNIYYLVGDHEKSIHYYDQCLHLFEEINDSTGIGYMYTNFGNYYESKKDFDKSNEYYHKALTLQKKLQNEREQVVIYNNLGNLYYKHRKDTSALIFFNMALDKLDKVSEPSTHTLVYVNIGDYFLWAKNNQKAEYYLNIGYQLSLKHNFSVYLSDICKSLGELYANKGNFSKAYYFQNRHLHLRDSLLERNNASKISFLDFQYQNERADYHRTMQKIELKRKARARGILLIGVSVIAISVILVVAVLYRSHKRKERLKLEKLELEKDFLSKQLEFRNKEIVIKTMNLFERNELIRQVVARLRTVTPEVKRTCQVELESIVGDLRARYQDNVIAEFEVRFKEVHKDFYNQIKEQHPNLTGNDLKLCAFLKMKLTSKDIATLTHQPINSIQMARKRLRKKLGFENTETDLEDYISRF
jgi:hypothetical protein